MTHKRRVEDELVPGYMDTLETVDSGVSSPQQIELVREFEAICPVDGHIDEYTLHIEYRPNDGEVLELRSFSELLDSFADVEAPQETWCGFLTEALHAFLSPAYLRVEIAGDHYGVKTTTVKEREA